MKNEEHNEYLSDLDSAGELREPALYQILVHNDDFTPMEFVIEVLEKYFYVDRSRAAKIALAAHVGGQGRCGWFGKDYAETKVAQVRIYTEIHAHPLRFSLEGVEGVSS